MENDRIYFRRRAVQERSAAAHALGKARAAHEEMAREYEELSHLGQAPVPGEPVGRA